MSDGIVIAIITASTSILLSLITLAQAAAQKRQSKKSDTQTRLDSIEKKQDSIEKKLDKLSDHNDMQYLSLLRLTVMNTDMPMTERLIAGQEYLDRGGNGDVRKFYEHLKVKVDSKEADDA